MRKSVLALLVGLGILVLAVASLMTMPAAPSYADTVPTPVSAQAGSGSTDWLAVTFWSADALAASAGSNAIQLPGYDSLDIQYLSLIHI
jgi:hypothetical protein